MRWMGRNPRRKSRFENVSAKRWLEEVRATQQAIREASISADGRRETLNSPLVRLFLGLLRRRTAGSAAARGSADTAPGRA